MRMKKVMITAFLVLVVLMGKAQVQPTTTLLGSWSGKLNVGTVSLTLVLHLDQADGYVFISGRVNETVGYVLKESKDEDHCQKRK